MTVAALGIALPGLWADDEWGETRRGTLTDGWLASGVSGGTELREVDVRQSADGLKFLVEAPFAAEGGGDLTIDCTDAAFVRIAPVMLSQDAGEGDGGDGAPRELWGFTRALWLEAAAGYSPAELTEAGLNSTLSDGVITLRQCTVGFSAEPAECGSTMDAGGDFHDTVITLPDGMGAGGSGAVETVVDNVDEPAEYYSLQGVRINRPAAGELVIVHKKTRTYLTVTSR